MRFLFDVAHFQLAQILVFGSLLLGGYYFTLYDDGSELRETIQTIQTDTRRAEAQIEQTEKEIEDVKIFEKEILAEEESVKYFLNFVPNTLTFTEVSTLLIKEAKSSGVNISLKKDKIVNQEEDSEYHTLNIGLTISGSFSNILLFLSKLTAQKRILIVNNIDMTVNRQNQLIESVLDISAYRYQEIDKKEKAGSEEKK